MAKVLLYGGIDSESSKEFITAVNAITDGELDVLVNSPGGNPQYGWGMVEEFQRFNGKKKVSNQGQAHSTAAFFNLYADECTALDVTEFLIHRAAYPSWIEEDILKDSARKGNLERLNKKLEDALRAKVDVEKFEKLPDMVANGWTISDIFALDARREIFLTAKQAKQVGLINKIVKITPEKKAMIEAKMIEIAAKYSPTITEEPKKKEVEQKTTIQMTLEEFKAKHPELFAQVYAQGVENERTRVSAWAENASIDVEAAIAGINGGKEMKASDIMNFAIKAVKAGQIQQLEQETNTIVATSTEQTVDSKTATGGEQKTAAQEIEAKMFAHLKSVGVLKSEIN